MKIWQKLFLLLAASAGFSILAVAVWFIATVLSSPSEPEGFGQDHQEQWAVASCWRDIRDGRIAAIEDCSNYAQAHLDFFTSELAADAATTTCNLSRSHLAYTRKGSPDAKTLIGQLEEEVRSDCSHPDVSR